MLERADVQLERLHLAFEVPQAGTTFSVLRRGLDHFGHTRSFGNMFDLVIAVLTRVCVKLAVLEQPNLVCYVFDKSPVVRHQNKGAGKLFECVLERFQHFHVQVVGRLVQNQKIVALEREF